jgi:lambda repressor-like predicted transcriptional regulator
MKWVDVPGWEGLYEVSNAGLIRSKDRFVPAKGGAVALRKGRALRLVEKTNGYLCVTLANGLRRPQLSVHKIVARAFIGECPLGLHVLHGDGNKRNNAAKNLRYGTPSENLADTERHGRRPKGETHPMATLTADAVRDIRKSTQSGRELAAAFGVSPGHISQVRRGKVWRHL